MLWLAGWLKVKVLSITEGKKRKKGKRRSRIPKISRPIILVPTQEAKVERGRTESVLLRRPVLPPAIHLASTHQLNRSSHRSKQKSRRKSSANSKPLPPLPPAVSPARSHHSPQLSDTTRAFGNLFQFYSRTISTSFDMASYKAVMKVLYDYQATSPDEVDIKEDQIVYLLDDSDEEYVSNPIPLRGLI